MKDPLKVESPYWEVFKRWDFPENILKTSSRTLINQKFLMFNPRPKSKIELFQTFVNETQPLNIAQKASS